MGKSKRMTITVHLYPERERDCKIQEYIEQRDKNQYPYQRDYVIAAIEAFEAGEEKPVTLSELRQVLANLQNSAGKKPMLP